MAGCAAGSLQGKGLKRYSFWSRCLCSSQQQLGMASPCRQQQPGDRTKPQSLPAQSRGQGVAVFPKAVFELCQLAGLKFILCPLPLSAAHGRHTFLCSVTGRTLGLPVDRANSSFCCRHPEITCKQLVRGGGRGSSHDDWEVFWKEGHFLLTAFSLTDTR